MSSPPPGRGGGGKSKDLKIEKGTKVEGGKRKKENIGKYNFGSTKS